MEKKVKKEYFIASNGYKGFTSYYDTVLNPEDFDKIYIITGGSGTGKSYMMKELASYAEEAGADVEFIYCSSDPTSLDAAIFEKNGRRVGILDGTAPHERYMIYPGLSEEIINLGEFWNSDLLAESKESAKKFMAEKKKSYKTAYLYLSALESIDGIKEQIAKQVIDTEKIRSAILRLIKQLKISKPGKERIRLSSALSMMGSHRFETFEELADKIYVITDKNHSALFYLQEMRIILKEKSLSFTYIPSTKCENYPEGIYVDSIKTLFVSEEFHTEKTNSDCIINMQRFFKSELSQEEKKELRYLSAQGKKIESTALEHLKQAGKIHFKIEEIYYGCMDFTAKEKYTDKIKEKILKTLCS